MRVLTDYEKILPNEQELIYHWLDTGIINCADIINSYVGKLNAEKSKLNYMLSKSDVYVATLIDNDKNMINMQRPRAIQYMLDNERLKGSQWYKDLEKINVESDYEHIKNL